MVLSDHGAFSCDLQAVIYRLRDFEFQPAFPVWRSGLLSSLPLSPLRAELCFAYIVECFLDVSPGICTCLTDLNALISSSVLFYVMKNLRKHA